MPFTVTAEEALSITRKEILRHHIDDKAEEALDLIDHRIRIAAEKGNEAVVYMEWPFDRASWKLTGAGTRMGVSDAITRRLKAAGFTCNFSQEGHLIISWSPRPVLGTPVVSPKSSLPGDDGAYISQGDSGLKASFQPAPSDSAYNPDRSDHPV